MSVPRSLGLFRVGQQVFAGNIEAICRLVADILHLDDLAIDDEATPLGCGYIVDVEFLQHRRVKHRAVPV